MSNFESMYFPVSTFTTDEELMGFLRKIRERVVRWKRQQIHLSFMLGREVACDGTLALLHKDPPLEVTVIKQVINRVDCIITSKALKKWCNAVKGKASATERTLATGLMYVEVLKRHPDEREPPKKPTA